MIKISRSRDGQARVTFSVPDAGPPVSVVGDFNGWDPTGHRLRRRSNGTRSVAVALDPGRYEYRYLYGDDGWASEDGDGDRNSVVVVPADPPADGGARRSTSTSRRGTAARSR